MTAIVWKWVLTVGIQKFDEKILRLVEECWRMSIILISLFYLFLFLSRLSRWFFNWLACCVDCNRCLTIFSPLVQKWLMETRHVWYNLVEWVKPSRRQTPAFFSVVRLAVRAKISVKCLLFQKKENCGYKIAYSY